MITEKMTAAEAWNYMYEQVLKHGYLTAPRDKKTLEINNVVWTLHPHQHLDPRAGRNISLDYIRREFLWYCQGMGQDTRIAKYAPIWTTCIDEYGWINSNYGQYIFGDGFEGQLWWALDQLIKDQDSRRCWISIFQSYHHDIKIHNDYPCHTGFGFTIRNGKLHMSIHHRSLDMWHGAAQDFPIAFFWQLLAQTYLRKYGIFCEVGPITHYVESAHFYERHFVKAINTVQYSIIRKLDIPYAGFDVRDLDILFKEDYLEKPSQFLTWILDIAEDYGKEDERYIGVTW